MNLRSAPLSSLLIAGLCILAGGCQSGKLPDPNSENEIANYPEIMMRNLVNWRTKLDRKVAKKELSTEQRDAMMAEKTNEYLQLISPEMATEDNAWIYGDLFRDGGRWDDAYRLYDAARRSAKTEDRRVNDSLRFARAAAKLKKHDEALAAIKDTFDTPAEEKAPILPAVLYEVVAAAEEDKKAPFVQYAKVLEEAIKQHLVTQVDRSTDPGRAFLAAKPTHLSRAWSKVVGLYQSGGDLNAARAAIKRADDVMRQSAIL